MLGDAQPLVVRLWAHEVAAAPLATAEERAALKTRLLTHADTIADADVRHHYREAFRERIDALFARARPERGPRVPWAPQQRGGRRFAPDPRSRSEEHTSELQSLMRISYAVFFLKQKKNITHTKKVHRTNKY